jgi:glycosyltransferase involved in cell wall biosynthesis
MTVAVHVVTETLPPVAGGLERWTHELAERMEASGFRVVVYVCGLWFRTRDSRAYDVVNIAELRGVWEAPLVATAVAERVSRERGRLNVLLLRAQIAARVAAHPYDKHCLLSTFALGIGHHAMIAARDLNLPHVAVIAGTDFSRGFRNPIERAALSELCATAWCVVCKSGEQVAAVQRDMAPRRCELIPTSVDYPLRSRAVRSPLSPIRLFADCGVSYQKGTGVLLESFRTLLRTQQRVTLTLCGGIFEGQEAFWQPVLDATTQSLGPAFTYLGHIPREQVHALVGEASVYCSASLGEGSSAGRISALCSGIPMVTTRCGEFVCEVPAMSHVRLVEPGAADEFASELAALVADVSAGTVKVDWEQVEHCRASFSPEAEWSAWEALISAAGAGV